MKLNSPKKQGVWYYSMDFRIKVQPRSKLDPVQNSCHPYSVINHHDISTNSIQFW